MDLAKTVLDRFLKYVAVDTGSNEEAPDKAPSTDSQLVLLEMLRQELLGLKLKDVVLHEGGVLTAELPANAPRKCPVVGFIAHVDTYPGTANKGVKAQVIRAYDGKDIVFAAAPEASIRVADNPGLTAYAGETVITTDGTTLLGADDKAGVAEIMTAIEYLVRNPQLPHGTIKVAFTPDEEIGRGTEHFPELSAFGADLAYTVDGGEAGEIENETFCADSAQVILIGRDVHPGYAKGKMINAVRAAAKLISLLPGHSLPETTDGQQGYLHPLGIEGDVNRCKVSFIVRDFKMEGLKALEAVLSGLIEQVKAAFPGLGAEFTTKHSYKNMKVFLDKDPRVEQLAVKAILNCGITPIQRSIRGGTDGARLSEKGLLTPNLFAGGRNFHSVQEWVPLADMEKAVKVILELVRLWHTEG